MTATATATMKIINELGMHARAATVWVQLASEYESDVYISKDGREINGKSIMGVLLLTATMGTTIEVRAEGPDCEELIAALEELVTNRFGEER